MGFATANVVTLAVADLADNGLGERVAVRHQVRNGCLRECRRDVARATQLCYDVDLQGAGTWVLNNHT